MSSLSIEVTQSKRSAGPRQHPQAALSPSQRGWPAEVSLLRDASDGAQGGADFGRLPLFPAGQAVLQRCGSTPAAACACHDAPPVVGQVLRSPGSPLDAGARSLMEARFGRDFGDVRVHTGSRAAESARAVDALAYTVGKSIVFGAGQYAPGTDSGRRVLTHELTHVTQQGAGAIGLAGLRVGPADDHWEREADAMAARHGGDGPHLAGQHAKAPAGVLRRTPGKDAPDSWNAFVKPALPKNQDQKSRAVEAIRRLMLLKSGAWVINALYTLFCKTGKCGTSVTVKFVDTLPKGVTDSSGMFSPAAASQPLYEVLVKNVAPSTGGGITLGGMWPGGTSQDVYFTYTDPESSMAETIYHELLHVWFVNTQQGAVYPTGHGDVLKGQIEPVFHEGIRRAIGEMNILEKRIHAEAKQREQQQKAQPTAPSRLDTPEPKTRPSGGPSLFGGEVSLRGGGARVGGSGAGAGILGADLVLNKIYSLRLGARGVYLTPNHLLVGGTLGLRKIEEGTLGRRVENPLFFDIEAGILGEVTPSEGNRLTKNVAGIGSVGLGQEFGTQGPRFFWRVGGFVIISDKGEASGGGTAGAGVRF